MTRADVHGVLIDSAEAHGSGRPFVARAGSRRASARRGQYTKRLPNDRCRAAGGRELGAASPSSSGLFLSIASAVTFRAGAIRSRRSLLMTAIPAVAAGVREVMAVCPRPEPVVMAAALEAGVSRLFQVGGAHAIAALAYGTRIGAARGQDRRPGETATSRPRRRSSQADCGIDFYAGPTEILIVASRGGAWRGSQRI